MSRNKHTLSNYHLLSAKMGQMIPIGLQEALPGDTFQMHTSAMIRVSPLAAPVMHPVKVRIHHFFVPHRIVWDGFEEFITGGPDGNNADTIPTLAVPADPTHTLLDYLGIPPNATGVNISALPLRGINMIWNEYYRDQDLQTERLESATDVPYVSWEKDYFSSARPWTQKGDDVTIPIGDRAPVLGIGRSDQNYSGSGNIYQSDGTIRTGGPDAGTNIFIHEHDDFSGYPGIYTDLSQAEAVNINEFRKAFALQRYAEARARYGSCYTEYLRYLGVTPSDARLQRPEFLGGGSTRLNFSEVLRTADEGGAEAPGRDSFGIGDMYGHGIAAMRTNRFRRFIEEHGYIHSFMSVRPKAVYMNGVHRTFLKATREDFWQKELEQIGQQPIAQNEIYASSGQETDVFGYQDRYREYRETPSLVAGEYRDELNFWHMARDLPANTTLNSDFIECVPTERIHNVQTNDTLWCMINNHCVARRLVRRNANSRIL